MIIYRAKYKKELESSVNNRELENAIKHCDHLYLTKHTYDIANNLGLTYEYQLLNHYIVIDISELEFIEECPKIEC
jgi:hypothetical protein